MTNLWYFVNSFKNKLMRKIITLAFILSTFYLTAKIDNSAVDVRPFAKEVLETIKTENLGALKRMGITKEAARAFQMTLNENMGKGIDPQIEKVLKEVDQLVASYDQFSARQIGQITEGFMATVNFANENKFKWADAKYLYETFEIKKRGPFQIDASGGINLEVVDSEGAKRRIILKFRVLLIGDTWELVEGVKAELDPAYENRSDSSSDGN